MHREPVDIAVRHGTLEHPSAPVGDERPLVVADHQLEVPVAGRLQGGSEIVLDKLSHRKNIFAADNKCGIDTLPTVVMSCGFQPMELNPESNSWP